MKLSFAPLLTAAVVSLSSCDRVKEVAKQSADAALDRVKTDVEKEIRATIEDTEVLKSGREYAEKAKSALSQVNLDALKREVEQVKEAIASGNYAEAEKLSQSVDKFFGVDVVGDTVGLMKIRADEGAEAAQRKLAEYLSLPGLDSRQKQDLEKIGGFIANLDGKDRDASVKILALAVASGCESKFGHGSGGLAMVAMSAVFPGLTEDPGKQPFETPPVER